MGQQRRQRAKRDDDHPLAPQQQNDQGELKSSAVLPKSVVSWARRLRDLDPWLPGEDPPWSVVDHYLANGDEEAGVEEYAKQSRAFAYVLESMRNQEEDAMESDLDDADPPPNGPPAPPFDD